MLHSQPWHWTRRCKYAHTCCYMLQTDSKRPANKETPRGAPQGQQHCQTPDHQTVCWPLAKYTISKQFAISDQKQITFFLIEFCQEREARQPVLCWPRCRTGAAARARQPHLRTRARAVGPQAAALLRLPAAHARVVSPEACTTRKDTRSSCSGAVTLIGLTGAAHAGRRLRCRMPLRICLQQNAHCPVLSGVATRLQQPRAPQSVAELCPHVSRHMDVRPAARHQQAMLRNDAPARRECIGRKLVWPIHLDGAKLACPCTQPCGKPVRQGCWQVRLCEPAPLSDGSSTQYAPPSRSASAFGTLHVARLSSPQPLTVVQRYAQSHSSTACMLLSCHKT